MALSADILRGYTDTIILRQLSEGDSYGYQINKNVSVLSGGAFEISCLRPAAVAIHDYCQMIDFAGDFTHSTTLLQQLCKVCDRWAGAVPEFCRFPFPELRPPHRRIHSKRRFYCR